MEKKIETTVVCLGVMEEKMQTTMVCWGYTGVMENKMEITGVIKGFEHFRFQYGVCGIVAMYF